MTVVAALRTTDSVLMGADSALSTNNNTCQRLLAHPKVFQVGGYVFGVSGNPLFAQMLQFGFAPPQRPDEMPWLEFMMVNFLPAVERRCVQLKNSQILIGTEAREIFRLGEDGCVVQVKDDYTAIGSGADFALGSFHSTAGLEPRQRLMKALEAAAYLDPYVRPPFTVLELAGDDLIKTLLTEEFDRETLLAGDPDDHGYADEPPA